MNRETLIQKLMESAAATISQRIKARQHLPQPRLTPQLQQRQLVPILRMIRFAIAALICQTVFATSWDIPKPPEDPTPDALLRANGLADADESELVRYLLGNESAIPAWIPEIAKREEDVLASQYVQRLDARDPNAAAFLKQKAAELTKQRLQDPRRIVDAALRKLGRSGTIASIDALLGLARYVELPWAQWKVLASIQEILAHEDPTKAKYHEIRTVETKIVAPLLRDLSSDKAEAWAWALWETGHQPASPIFRSYVPLPSRLWLARFLAKRKPQLAADVFQDGLRSHDAATRTLAEMLLRECLGGSLPHGTEGRTLLELLQGSEARPARAFWEAFPKPLDSPLVLANGHGSATRRDLVWLDRAAKVVKRENDVWPMVRHVLPNGLFYSRVGDHFRMTYALTGSDGAAYSRFHELGGDVTIASHGGIWSQAASKGNATEFAPDGSVLWQCPLSPSHIRAVAPYTAGRVLCLGYKSLECRNRRGDVLWKTDLGKLDDPREVLAVGEGKFLLSCGKSVGWLLQTGEYTPVVEKLGSAGWIRYHPTSEWVIFDGASWEALIYDAASGLVTGRLDLDDGGENAKSKFAKDVYAFPE